mmetsp:Transcript_31652/g.69173  ORF Transcript_31652/g.69173 Transcript_31652/m.69173 type:complete len:241 (-) Transcript_31652:473-1195(-)|eukprot:CAMPEP_0118928388 /NCGR_PEP_ID=MMETSP1169-20130426/5647_1 /TAXON_ID=36882 /ORGANISM="Pyramimonas obovata, Strain CCMP722" /LENGTH=240 /DNA_ID=CAMNT_0006870341 /DNA_START=25 /DNA_END=747 /DNA_ORIENTATION=-
MGRGKNDGRAQRRKNAGNTQSGAEAAALQKVASSFGANVMPEEVSHADAAVFYQIVVSQSWEEVEAKIAQVVAQGLLTEGVLLAGYTILEQAQAGKEDERTIQNIAQICMRLTELLQNLKATPVLRLVDQWAQMLESKPKTAVAEVQRSMQETFAEASVCTQQDFVTEIQQIIERMEQQDQEFEESVKEVEAAAGGAPTAEQQANIAEQRKQRKDAGAHVRQLHSLALAAGVAATLQTAK